MQTHVLLSGAAPQHCQLIVIETDSVVKHQVRGRRSSACELVPGECGDVQVPHVGVAAGNHRVGVARPSHDVDAMIHNRRRVGVPRWRAGPSDRPGGPLAQVRIEDVHIAEDRAVLTHAAIHVDVLIHHRRRVRQPQPRRPRVVNDLVPPPAGRIEDQYAAGVALHEGADGEDAVAYDVGCVHEVAAPRDAVHVHPGPEPAHLGQVQHAHLADALAAVEAAKHDQHAVDDVGAVPEAPGGH
mmetsp:Transcript_34626/g.85849  ORF Transcript_34626/g.85849 Transcript_34626/m.85849 type:complete len:241 (+) Transcript_34626:303-1025(+)